MYKINYAILCMLLFLVTPYIKAQTPATDPAWILQTSGTEEFNSTLDTVNKWRARYSFGNYNNGAEYNYPANLIQTGTTLKIKADTLLTGVHIPYSEWAIPNTAGVTCAYQSGAISSRPSGGVERYHYGYVEGYAKVPTGAYSYWPGLWLFSCNVYNEIDFMEPKAPDCYNGYQYGTNIFLSNSVTTCSPTSSNYQLVTGVNLMSAAFHKYATEWGPDRVNYYYDDVLVRSVYDPTGAAIPQNPMMAIINFCVDPDYAFLPSDWNAKPHGNATPTHWPQYFEIDYLRYYKLNVDCSNNLTICTPATDYSTRAVKKTITTGGACSPTFNTSDSYTLRATDYVTLDAGTTITDNGSGRFSVVIIACPQ